MRYFSHQSRETQEIARLVSADDSIVQNYQRITLEQTVEALSDDAEEIFSGISATMGLMRITKLRGRDDLISKGFKATIHDLVTGESDPKEVGFASVSKYGHAWLRLVDPESISSWPPAPDDENDELPKHPEYYKPTYEQVRIELNLNHLDRGVCYTRRLAPSIIYAGIRALDLCHLDAAPQEQALAA